MSFARDTDRARTRRRCKCTDSMTMMDRSIVRSIGAAARPNPGRARLARLAVFVRRRVLSAHARARRSFLPSFVPPRRSIDGSNVSLARSHRTAPRLASRRGSSRRRARVSRRLETGDSDVVVHVVVSSARARVAAAARDGIDGRGDRDGDDVDDDDERRRARARGERNAG